MRHGVENTLARTVESGDNFAARPLIFDTFATSDDAVVGGDSRIALWSSIGWSLTAQANSSFANGKTPSRLKSLEHHQACPLKRQAPISASPGRVVEMSQ
jgi:hypothetical protein